MCRRLGGAVSSIKKKKKTASPVPVTRKFAPAFSRPCPPDMRNPPLMVFVAVVETEATLRLELVERVGCLAFIAIATSPIPVKVMLPVALSVDAATDATLRALLVVNVACFAESAVARSPTPVRLMLLVALSVDADTEATLRALPVVKVACFPFTAAARVPAIPATVTVPFR